MPLDFPGFRRVRRALLPCAFAVAACLQPAPDVSALRPVIDRDTALVVMLREADRVSERDPALAAATLRDTVLPRARANAADAARLDLAHPISRDLARRLADLTEARANLIARYADAMARDDVAAMLREVRAQRQTERDFARLDQEIARAARTPPHRGCSR